jgi:AraC family L-rhamnose operon transcriptional activator RhaR
VSQVDLRTPNLHIWNFALHRHQTDGGTVDPPGHHWSRAILCLSGSGEQVLAGHRVTLEPGVVVVLPPGQRPVFHSTGPRPVVRVEVEFHLKGSVPNAPEIAAITQGEFSQIREQLHYLLRIHSPATEFLSWEGAAVILQMLIMLLRGAGWLERASNVAVNGGDSAIHRLLLTMALEAPLRQVVERSGYQRDHLNRLVRKETGLTLGQFRTQRRLLKAKELLARGVKVGDVAGEVGLPDQSYFARWFRRQTGQSPSNWVQQEPAKSAADLVLQCG